MTKETKEYIVLIREVGYEKGIKPKSWEQGAGDGDDWGYAPEVETWLPVDREIFKQIIPKSEMDIVRIINAVNNQE